PGARREARRHGAQHRPRSRGRLGAERGAARALRPAAAFVIVLKFGGTSVGDAAAIRRTAGIVASRVERQPGVVVSALAGVTNALIALAEQAAKGHLIGAVRAVEALRERHLAQAEALLGTGQDSVETSAELSAMCDEL